MTIGIVGRKCGMSRIFTENGESVPVTLIEATPNRIVQVKTVENDGYNAVQVAAGMRDALAGLGNPALHLVLSDFKLADGDGLALLQEVRRQQHQFVAPQRQVAATVGHADHAVFCLAHLGEMGGKPLPHPRNHQRSLGGAHPAIE